jgi:hypothetical protein
LCKFTAVNRGPIAAGEGYSLRTWDGKLRRINSLEKRLEKIRDLRERGIA